MAKVKVQVAAGNTRVIDIQTATDVQNAIALALASFVPSTTTSKSTVTTAPLTADPTAEIGLLTIPGTSLAAMRSDAAPALDQSISPTWTGTHAFDNMITVTGHDVVLVTREINTGAGLSGGGALSSDLTLVNTGVLSLAGTTDEIDVSASTGAVTISIDSGYVGQTSITTLGTITTGVWDGTTIAIVHGGTGQTTANAAINALLPSQSGITSGWVLQTDGTNTSWVAPSGGGGGVTSLAGTAGEIDVSASTGAVTVSIDAAYVGQTSIDTLGTISTGVWEGTPIGVAYGGVPSASGVTDGWVLTSISATPVWAAPSGGSGDAYPQALGYAGI